MGIATGCGDDDGDDEDAGTDTDTDTDTDCDVSDAGPDGGPLACATVTGIISIGPGFTGPAQALIIALYEEEPNPAVPTMPEASASIEGPVIDSDTDYSLNQEVCGIVPGTDYYTGLLVYGAGHSATNPMPQPGDAQGLAGAAETYEACGTVDLGAVELEVIPVP
jgi:hypothetical protein